MNKNRRGRSMGGNPFERRDVDVSTNPSKKRCVISALIGIEWCTRDESCWFWGLNKKCCLSTLVVKGIVYLNSLVPNRGGERNGRREGRGNDAGFQRRNEE